MRATLFHGEPNGPSFTVLCALFETGHAAALEYLDLAAAARHADPRLAAAPVAMSVEGEGPVLLADGEAMADSVFIASYFDECAGGGKILPHDPFQRWAIMSWCRQIGERTAPAAAYLGCRAHLTPRLAALPDATFQAMLEPIVSDDLRRRWIDARANAYDPARLQDSEEKIAATLSQIEARLAGKDWLFGDFSLADLETYAWVAGPCSSLNAPFKTGEQTANWLRRVREHPSAARALSIARTAAPLDFWAPGPEINRWG